MHFNVKDNQTALITTSAVLLSSVAKIVVASIEAKKKANAQLPVFTPNPPKPEHDAIQQAIIEEIMKLDKAQDRLAGLQAMKAGDFDFDQFVRSLNK